MGKSWTSRPPPVLLLSHRTKPPSQQLIIPRLRPKDMSFINDLLPKCRSMLRQQPVVALTVRSAKKRIEAVSLRLRALRRAELEHNSRILGPSSDF